MLEAVVELITMQAERMGVEAQVVVAQALLLQALLEPQIQVAAVAVVMEIPTMMVAQAALVLSSFVMQTLLLTPHQRQAPQHSRQVVVTKSISGPDPVRSHSKRHQWHTLHS